MKEIQFKEIMNKLDDIQTMLLSLQGEEAQPQEFDRACIHPNAHYLNDLSWLCPDCGIQMGSNYFTSDASLVAQIGGSGNGTA